jgi:hypothetical protein
MASFPELLAIYHLSGDPALRLDRGLAPVE